MKMRKGIVAVLLCLAATASRAEFPARAPDSGDSERRQAFKLYDEHKMPEAAALLEKVVSRNPDDVAAHEALGVAVLSRADTEGDPEKARADRLYARKELLRAKELGDNSDLCRILLAGIAETGEAGSLSAKPEADAALQAGEAAYAKGDWQQALAAYSRAWDLEHSWRAALYIGDTYFGMKDMQRAGEWFAKAIEADPNKETAYRYWGDALMEQGKMKEARAKYIEGIVADPYQATSGAGLRKWLTANKLALKKIPITLPPGPSTDKDGKTSITLDASMFDKPDTGAAWLAYPTARAAWPTDQFLKQFPQEKTYRHSLAEEATALTTVVEVYAELMAGKSGKHDASLELLSKLKKEEMLEPFVLLTHADAGIVQDYASYRDAHRDKLNAFLDQYLVPPAP